MARKKTVEQKETKEPVVNVAEQVQELTAEQEIGALRAAHEFFGNYQGVPGYAASQWGQALDAIAVVANSLIKKAGLLQPAAKPEAPQQ